MKYPFSFILLVLVLTFYLPGCGSKPITINSTGAQSSPTSAPTVTTAPNTGVIKGAIYAEKNGNFVPIKHADLFLGYILISPSGKTGVAGLDASSAPRTSTDEQGRFIFQNISPGKYGLIFYLVTHAYLLNEIDKDASMIITVTAGKTTDLGQLNYTTFPITPEP